MCLDYVTFLLNLNKRDSKKAAKAVVRVCVCMNEQPGIQDYNGGLQQSKSLMQQPERKNKNKYIDFHRDVSRYVVSLAISEGGVSHFLPMRLSGGERLSGKYNRGV